MNVLSSVTSNPLLVRQIRKPKYMTAKMIVRRSGAITVILISIAVVACIIRQDTSPLALLLVTSVVSSLVVFPYVAYTVAIATVKETRAESYELLLLTSLHNARLSYGLLFQALYKVRVLLLFLITITPVQIVGLIYAANFSIQYCLSAPSTYVCVSQAHILQNFWTASITIFLMAIAEWGLIVLSAALGHFLALLWRNEYIAGLSTVFASLGLGYISFLAVTAVVQSISIVGELLVALTPYFLTTLLMKATERFIRRVTVYK